jgi:hypothetical protein
MSYSNLYRMNFHATYKNSSCLNVVVWRLYSSIIDDSWYYQMGWVDSQLLLSI